MVNLSEKYVLDGLEVARRVVDATNCCPPTLFLMKGGCPDWVHSIELPDPTAYARVAEEQGANAVIVVWSHSLIDQDAPNVQLFRLYSALINAKGELLKGASMQAWADEEKWTVPSILNGPLPLAPTSWVV